MPTGYHLSNIRTLLTEGFSAAELRDFCFDAPPFRPVHHELADLTGKAAIVSHLLEFAERKNLLGDLLTWAERTNPAKYAEYQPYQLNPSLASRAASPASLPLPRQRRQTRCARAVCTPPGRWL